MIESTIVNEWKAEAAAKALIKTIIGILEAKVGPLPADVIAKIESTKESDVLQQWAILAGKASSIDEFRRDAGI